MSFTNAQLAQQMADMIAHWSSFAEEYSDWLAGAVDGGPGSDGNYPLTDWYGTEFLVASPAKLADNVSGYVGLASASEAAAAASAAAAATSESNAASSASAASTDAAAAAASASAAAVDAGEADSSATVSTTQANLATDRVGYATEWANLPYNTLVSSAAGGDQVDDYSARHWAEHAASLNPGASPQSYLRSDVADEAAGVITFAATPIIKNAGGASQIRFNSLADADKWRIGASGDATDDFIVYDYALTAERLKIDDTTGDVTIGAALAVTGAVTGSNLNVSNWDTAFGWGDHGAVGYLTSETSHADVVVDGDFASNGILKRTAAGVYGIVTDNSANWDTAYGWGDHASAGYQAALTNTLTLESSAADATIFLKADTSNTVETANPFIRFEQDGNQVVAIVGQSGVVDQDAQGNVFTGALNNGFSIHQQYASGEIDLGVGGNVRLKVTPTGVVIPAAANGRLEITGSGYVVNPTGLALGQYTSTIGYIQAPASGRIAFWTDGTAEVAAIEDAGYMSFGGAGGGLTGVTGTYGAVQSYGSHGGYGGYSLDGNFVLMNSGSAHVGLYNDIDNEWMILAYPNSYVNIYHNGSARLTTSSTGVTVTGAGLFTGGGDTPTVFQNQNVVMSPNGTVGNDILHAAVCVKGGSFDATSSSYTGFCRIRFPTAVTNDSNMMTMMIHGYNYSGTNGTGDGGAWCIQVGGYFYSSENWHNTSARIVSGSPPFDRVYFGEDETGDYKYILLGTSTTQWDYPKVWLTDLTGGHTSQYNDWLTGTWQIDFSASTPSNWSGDSTASPVFLGGQIRWDGETSSNAASKSAGGRITISTSAASGGQDGDIHFKY